MKKVILKKLQAIILYPSFWKVVLLGLVLLIFLRHFSDKTEEPQRQAMVPIAVELFASQYSPVLQLSGFTKPKNHGVLKANFKAVVAKIFLQKGRVVKKGEPVLLLSSPEVEKRLAEAASRHKQKLAEYESAKKLTQKAFKAENTYLATQADLEQAVANLQKAETDAGELQVTAPEDGYLEECYVHEGDTVFAQDKLVQFIYEHETQVRLHVSEDNIANFKPGMEAMVEIGHVQYCGKISGISQMADPSTRNFYVDITLNEIAAPLPYGATAEVTIVLPKRKGFWVNASALTLSDDGNIGIKILENGKVAFVPVKLSSLTDQGSYVEYAADSVNLIAYGGEFLLPGQTPIVHWQKLSML